MIISGFMVRDQWYNEELQATTDRLENVVSRWKIEIIARGDITAEFHLGRIKSNGKFDFTYSRVDIRAKLPGKKVPGQHFGYWVPIMTILIGLNVEKLTSWSAGNRLNKIQGTVHHPDKHER